MIPAVSPLTLDFRADKVIYNARIMPAGTLACQALNFPRERIAKILEDTPPLTALVKDLNNHMCSPELLEPAKASIYQILSLMQDQPPFCYMDMEIIRQTMEVLLKPELCDAYPEICQADRRTATDARSRGAFLLKDLFDEYVYMLEHLGYSLEQYLDGMTSFAEELDQLENRKPDGLARATARRFPEIFSLDDESSWMAGANEGCQYLAVKDENGTPSIVRRNHYVSVAGLLRADFFEGLAVGHAPKKCLNCGRWFLTTNGRHTKYCDGIDPNSKKGESCRSVGNRKRREYREKAEDNPQKALYITRRDSIGHRVNRDKLDPLIGSTAKLKAKNHLNLALQDTVYAQNQYEADMEIDALIAEATREVANANN